MTKPRTAGTTGGALTSVETELYDEWKRSGPHLEEYASELLGTAFLLFCVVGIVSFMFGTTSPLPRLLPSPALRLLLTGLLLGGASWAVALSPPGRLSGAHLNPAISGGFWLLGKMHGRDVAGYVAGQIAGAVLGTWGGRAVFGRLAQEVQVGSLHPGDGVGVWGVAAGEAGSTFVLAFAVFTFVSHKPLTRWTPAMAMVLVGILVCADGHYSGAGMNPARWFGPAFAAQAWGFAVAYTLAPILAALAAAGLRRSGLLTHAMPDTGKIFHDERYRSIFRGDTMTSRPPERSRQFP